MSQAAKNDGVLAIAAMPRGRRKASSNAAAAEAQDVSSIRTSAPARASKGCPKETFNKTAPKSKIAKGRPSRTPLPRKGKQAKQVTIVTQPKPRTPGDIRAEEQKRQREIRLENRQVNRRLSGSSPQGPGEPSRRVGRVPSARVPSSKAVRTRTKAASTQTVDVNTNDAAVQTEPIKAPLSQKALQWLERDFGITDHQPPAPIEVKTLHSSAEKPALTFAGKLQLRKQQHGRRDAVLRTIFYEERQSASERHSCQRADRVERKRSGDGRTWSLEDARKY